MSVPFLLSFLGFERFEAFVNEGLKLFLIYLEVMCLDNRVVDRLGENLLSNT
ncbi:MAG: hypothetical protein HOI66_01795 [Verrucomicrobia bacterium]|nr:hypothetical protein [Verrucomicrobiota bacterium]